MKIIFMGTPDFAVGTLEAINRAGHDIELVVTQPDKPRGRSGKLQMSDVKQYAVAHGLPVYQPERVRDKDAIEGLREYEPELIVVAAFGQILPGEILDMPKYGCINVHASLLPKLRGASPIQTAILEGEDETGVTIQQMGEGLDTGDIISQRSLPILVDDTGGSLFDKLAELGAKLAVDTIDDIENGRICPVPQDESRATYAKKIEKHMGKIDWSLDALVIERMIRALDPWPSTYTHIDGKLLKIWRASAVTVSSDKKSIPGTVTGVSGDSIAVSCGKGSLLVKEVQLEGKKRMEVHDFLLGCRIEPGTCLGADKAKDP